MSALIETFSNSAHIHLLLNHVPTVGFGLGLALFLVALLARNRELEKTSLGIFFLVAVATIATYVSGSGAESVLRTTAPAAAFPPSVLPAAIRAHEDAALLATILMEATGFFAWLGLWQWRKLSKLAAWNTGVVLVLSLATFGLMARTAELGGEIRHAEIRAENTPLTAITLDAAGRCRIDMAPNASYRFDRNVAAAGASPATVQDGATVPAGAANAVVQGAAGDVIVAGECVYLSDGYTGTQAEHWYQVTSEIAYLNTLVGLAQRDIQKEETGPIRVLGRLTSDLPTAAVAKTDGGLSTAGTGLARSLGFLVTGQTWLWPTCETLHFVGLSLLFTVVLIVDLRMLGMVKMVSFDALYQLLPLGMLGFGLNLVTGMLFFIGAPGQYVHNITFFWKIVFVLLGGLNVTYFMFADDAWTVRSGESAPVSSKFAAASAIFIWVAVLFCGHMLPFLGNAF